MSQKSQHVTKLKCAFCHILSQNSQNVTECHRISGKHVLSQNVAMSQGIHSLQFLHPSTEKKVVPILYSRDINCEAYNYYKVAGDNFSINISAIPRMQQCSIHIVSLNEHMAFNLNEYMFLK